MIVQSALRLLHSDGIDRRSSTKFIFVSSIVPSINPDPPHEWDASLHVPSNSKGRKSQFNQIFPFLRPTQRDFEIVSVHGKNLKSILFPGGWGEVGVKELWG